MPPPAGDVLIVGGGPTGLAAANALGLRGVSVLLVEQDAGVAELPRAVSIDDEGMRLMQALDLRAEAEGVVLPGTGTKYFGARDQLLVYARGPERPSYGHPVKNPMDHPQFQQVLLDGARRFDNVDIRHRTRLLGFSQDATGIEAEIDGPAGRETVRSRYLIGCDGGRSRVREQIGQEPLSGLAFEERWLVVDTINDHHDQRYAMHHGDPERPRVVVVGREGRCRYEFLVHDDERPEGDESLAMARRLVAPYRKLEDRDIVRCTVYKFYALVASRWSKGRAYLAGDAAHMMPPFAGQGLNSGLRDAANLSWKLAAVLRGQAGAELLETYQTERKPHVEGMVRLSVRLGKVMMTRSRLRAGVRDAVLGAGTRLPVFGRFLREMRFKPPAHYNAGLFIGDTSAGSPVGSLLVQPRVLDAGGRLRHLDDMLGRDYAVLAVETPASSLDQLSSPVWKRLGATRVQLAIDDRLPQHSSRHVSVSDADGLLAEQLREHRGRLVVVRPDRFILGSFTLDEEAAFAARIESLVGLPAQNLVPAEAA